MRYGMEIKIVNIGTLIEPLIKDIAKRNKTPEIQITLLPKLNDHIWGIRKRKLTVIGARPSNGKSAFAVQLCDDAANQGLRRPSALRIRDRWC